MSVEIERKFLVDHTKFIQYLAESNVAHERWSIEQGYLSIGDPVLRVRRSFSITNPSNCKHVFTLKGPGLVSRTEIEFILDPPTGNLLLAQCKQRLTKIRYSIDRWEIDVFTGPLSGLVLAEIELESEDEVFDRPSFIGVEVSMDRTYSNVNLATRVEPWV